MWKYIQYIQFHVQIQMEERVKVGAGYELCQESFWDIIPT